MFRYVLREIPQVNDFVLDDLKSVALCNQRRLAVFAGMY